MARELEAGRFEAEASDEDIHTAVERRVTELAGVSLTPDQVTATISARAAPRLTEDWFC